LRLRRWGATGNLTPTGGTLALNNNSSIGGNLQMSGGSLSLSNVSVGGNLQIESGGTFSIGSGVTIAGDLQLSNPPRARAQTRLVAQKSGATCHSRIVRPRRRWDRRLDVREIK
jgi:hypothetical protein